jgi:hypothetical protein
MERVGIRAKIYHTTSIEITAEFSYNNSYQASIENGTF